MASPSDTIHTTNNNEEDDASCVTTRFSNVSQERQQETMSALAESSRMGDVAQGLKNLLSELYHCGDEEGKRVILEILFSIMQVNENRYSTEDRKRKAGAKLFSKKLVPQLKAIRKKFATKPFRAAGPVTANTLPTVEESAARDKRVDSSRVCDTATQIIDSIKDVSLAHLPLWKLHDHATGMLGRSLVGTAQVAGASEETVSSVSDDTPGDNAGEGPQDAVIEKVLKKS